MVFLVLDTVSLKWNLLRSVVESCQEKQRLSQSSVMSQVSLDRLFAEF